MRLRNCSLRRFEKTFENSHWRKVIQMQPMWLCICSGRRLRRHLKTHSGKKFTHSGEKSFKCNQWDYEFLLAGSVRRHLKTHSWAQLAHHHLFIHSGEKTHHFGSSLSQAGDLKKHLLIHTGEKPFKCAKCRFSSAESSGLNIGDGVFEVTPWERQCLSCRRWSWCASCLFCQQLVCRSPTGAAPSCLHPH